MVPDATFTSYYGRPVVKAVTVGGGHPGLPVHRRAGRRLLTAGGRSRPDRPADAAAGRSTRGAGWSEREHGGPRPRPRPSRRFLNMLRVVKPTSPMSVGTWILTAYGPGVVLAGAPNSSACCRSTSGRSAGSSTWPPAPPGCAAAVFAPAVASYTAVLLTDTATPAWHDAHRELPFVFVGSAAAASGGLGMVCAPARPGRSGAAAGGRGRGRRARRRAPDGALDGPVGGDPARRHRRSADESQQGPDRGRRPGRGAVRGSQPERGGDLGLLLMAGSACTRFGVFEAGQESAKDPRYTVVPQRERLDAAAPPSGAAEGGVSAR